MNGNLSIGKGVFRDEFIPKLRPVIAVSKDLFLGLSTSDTGPDFRSCVNYNEDIKISDRLISEGLFHELDANLILSDKTFTPYNKYILYKGTDLEYVDIGKFNKKVILSFIEGCMGHISDYEYGETYLGQRAIYREKNAIEIFDRYEKNREGNLLHIKTLSYDRLMKTEKNIVLKVLTDNVR